MSRRQDPAEPGPLPETSPDGTSPDASGPEPEASPRTDTGEPGSAREQAERRRRRARVFGDVLPEATSDDRGDAWGDRDAGSDEWLRRQVPPHHG